MTSYALPVASRGVLSIMKVSRSVKDARGAVERTQGAINRFRRRLPPGSGLLSPADPLGSPTGALTNFSDRLKLIASLQAEGRPAHHEHREMSRWLDMLKVEVDRAAAQVVLPPGETRPERGPMKEVYESLGKLARAVGRLKDTPGLFGEHLKELMERCRLSPYGLAKMVEVDDTHLRRLLRGEKSNPRRDLVARLANELYQFSDVSARDVERLFKLAGYGPLPPRRKEIDREFR